MSRRIALASTLLGSLACAAVFSCSSSNDAGGPEDAGADTSVSPRPDSGAPEEEADAGADAAKATPKPLEVACEVDPCYVAVSGNSGRHLCGLVRDGTVRCWGRDSRDRPPEGETGDGALGRGAYVAAPASATPALVVDLADATQISVGPNFGTCARTRDGSVYCWGRNDFGQLGRPPTEDRLSRPTRIEGLPPVDEVALGSRTGCAIGQDRALYCWGEVTEGLGVEAGDTTFFSPQRINTFTPPLQTLVIGTWENRDTIITLREGNVLANAGAAAVGETSLLNQPLAAPREIRDVMNAGAFAYVANDGVLTRWESDFSTVSAERLYLPMSTLLVAVRTSNANLPRGEQQGGALLSTGHFFRWGVNTGGTLGLPPETVALSRYPVEVSQVEDVVSFATTYRATCVSLVSGRIECWGANADGELGRGAVDFDAHPEAGAIQ